MMSRLFITCTCVLALAASIFAEGNEYDERAIRRGDDYIDKLLTDMFEDETDKYDPYTMEDSAVGFHKKVVFVNVSGEAKLHNGDITGLRSLHRSDHCSLHDEGARLRVKADLGAGVLNFHYSGSAKFMQFGPTITVKGTLSYIEVRMEFTVDAESGENGKLEEFNIDDMRGMKVQVSGLGPINWALNPIISGVTKIFKRAVRNFMERKVRKHLVEKLPGFKFPVVEGKSSTQDPVNTPESTDPTEEPKETSPESETDLTEERKETLPETNPTEEINSSETEETTTLPELETIAHEESEERNPLDSETNAPEESKGINSPKHDSAVEEVSFLHPDRETSSDSSGDEPSITMMESE